MNGGVNLDLCRPGDSLEMSNGRPGLYVAKDSEHDDVHWILACGFLEAWHTDGSYYDPKMVHSVVQIVRPTVAEKEAICAGLLASLKWAVGEMQGDSGTGDTFWSTNPEYIAALKRISAAGVAS